MVRFDDQYKIKGLEMKKYLEKYKKNYEIPWAYASIIFLAVALYIGFDELLISEDAGTARETLNAAIGAIFVIVTTMYMFTAQTKVNMKMLRQEKEIEQDKELSVEISKNRLKLYESALDTWRQSCYIDEITKAQLGEVIHTHLHLAMIGSEKLLNSSDKITKQIMSVYSDDTNSKMDNDQQNKIYGDLAVFVSLARSDLKIPGPELSPSLIASFIENTKQASKITTSRNYDKFSFNGEIYNKRQLVLALVKYVVKTDKIETLEDLKETFKDTLWNNGKISKNKSPHIVALVSTAEEVDHLKERHFWNDDDIMKLGNGDSIVVNNQWGNNINYFIEYLPAHLKTKIKRQ